MNILRSVRVEGFWGSKNFTIDFNQDVNFLIGVNGSGKTTLINLIAAGLTADLLTLERTRFAAVEINLLDVKTNRKPSIEITKRAIPDLPFPELTYAIKDNANARSKKYSIDDLRHASGFPRRQFIEFSRRRSSAVNDHLRSEEHTSELQSHSFISYAVFCLKK